MPTQNQQQPVPSQPPHIIPIKPAQPANARDMLSRAASKRLRGM